MKNDMKNDMQNDMRNDLGDGAATGPPVDTLTPPHEPVVDNASAVPILSLLLVGPIVWMSHFWVVYLAAESACAAERSNEITFVGQRGLTTVIVITTVVGVLVCLAAAVQAWRRRSSMLGRVGIGLSLGGAAAILAVGLPIAVLSPC